MATSSLDQQLDIPPDAFLPTKSCAAQLRTSTGSCIPISPTTSIHSSTKYLLVGRQASTADIRIDHKSISRKHALIYLLFRDDGHCKIILKDLGGKYGCHINGIPLSKNQTATLQKGDKIQFGNVRETIFTLYVNEKELSEIIQCNNRQKNEGKTDIGEEGHVSSIDDDMNQKAINGFETALTGRAAREAEIAKAVASLDEMPTYTKYIPVQDDESQGVLLESYKKGELRHEYSKDLSMIASELKLPVASSIQLSAHSKSLPTSIALDPSGSRVMVGSSDTSLGFYDFNGMDLSGKPFKIVTVQEGHSIVKVVTSNTGDRMIVGTTSSQPMLLDRDGREIIEFNKGDMYVTDMARTDGHVSSITSVDWHPLNRDLVLTSSIDGSVRIWNVETNKTKFDKLCSGKEVYRIKCAMGKRTKVLCAVFSPCGREFACGTVCGSIQIWSTMKVGSRPERAVYDAHGSGTAVHSLIYSYDGLHLASRSMYDDCVKIWESKRISRSCKPNVICEGLHGIYEQVNCAFSPDGKMLCAGTCIDPKNQGRKDEKGVLKFYSVLKTEDATDALQKPVMELDVAKGLSIVHVVWHRKLNQIIVGLSNGSIRVYYDTNLSTKGAKLPVAKGLRTTDELTLLLHSRAPQGSAGILGEIKTPHALPLFRDASEHKTKRKREKERMDPIKSRRPDLPGTGIKVSEGTSANLNFQQTVLTSSIAKNKNIAGKDPREELFKYNEGKEYTKVPYDGNVRILAEKTAEEEEEEEDGA
jgi:WD40 repeat protein